MHPFARLEPVLPCILLGWMCACAPGQTENHPIGGTIRVGDTAGTDVPATVQPADESTGNDAADAPDEATEVDVPPVKPVDVVIVPDVETPDAAPEIAPIIVPSSCLVYWIR